MTSYQWDDGDQLDPFEIYITKGRYPSGKPRVIDTIRIHSPSLHICRSKNNTAVIIMGTSAGTAAKEQDKHIYIKVTGVTKDEVARKGKMSISLNEEDILLIYSNGQVHAVQAKCPHAGGPLHLGDIEDVGNYTCIKCPWHSWQFRIATGECIFPGNRPSQKLRVYPVKITGSEIRIGFDQIAPVYFQTPTS